MVAATIFWISRKKQYKYKLLQIGKGPYKFANFFPFFLR